MKYLLLILLFSLPSFSKLEKEYQIPWCQERGGIVEKVLFDGARIDCLTETHAYEFDFAKKAYEGISQALYYGAVTGKKPGLVLIITSKKDYKHVFRAKRIIYEYKLPIDLILLEDND